MKIKFTIRDCTRQLILTGLMLAGAVWSQGNTDISVESNVSKSEMTIGDKITYTITVTYPLKGTLELPAVLGNLGSFEVKDFSEGDPVEKDGAREQTWTIIISTYTTGSYTIPPQLLEYTPENDTAKIVTHTEPIMIQVNRSTAENVTDIADISGLARVKSGSFIKVWMILLLIFILAAFALWYFLLRGKFQEQEPPPLPPYEAAMESLSLLARQELLTGGRHKEYCFKLSEILRKFLNGRYALDALESTTEEFLKMIIDSPMTQANQDTIVSFCHKTDPVKFANVTLSRDEGKILFDEVKSVITQNKPREESAPQAVDKGESA